MSPRLGVSAPEMGFHLGKVAVLLGMFSSLCSFATGKVNLVSSPLAVAAGLPSQAQTIMLNNALLSNAPVVNKAPPSGAPVASQSPSVTSTQLTGETTRRGVVVSGIKWIFEKRRLFSRQ